MPTVLTTGATIVCAHGGQLDLTGSTKLTVSGKSVLTKKTVVLQPMKALPKCVPPSPATPCLHCASVSAGEATKLTVGQTGDPVLLLGTFAALTDGTAAVLKLTATETQTKLTTV